MGYIALIPAYKPEDVMLPFLHDLKERFGTIVVVDDGSGKEYKGIFDAVRMMGIDVTAHAVNLGKGRAIKTGINFILQKYPDCNGIVTADCDGQHAPEDIVAVREALTESPECLIIGGRRFTGNVPRRSRAGNAVMRVLFTLSTGMKIYDTQTGLRGIPRVLFSRLLRLPGERYEYEINMLLRLSEWDVKPKEIPIKTIYLNENKGSHYNTLRDSLRIAARMLLFTLGSIVSFLVDYAGFILLTALGLPYWAAFGIARVVSCTVNYLINSNVVFRGKCTRATMAKYYMLAAFVLALGMGVMRLTEALHVPVLIKLCYDLIMYVFNYFMQRDIVFRTKTKAPKADHKS